MKKLSSMPNKLQRTSTRKSSRSLILEKLQDRLVMAGNVTAVIDTGYLVLRGDDAANEVTIERVSGNQVRVSGTNNTTINGLTQPALLRVQKGFDLQMRGGDDKLTVIGLNAVGRYEIRMDLGAGNDTLVANKLVAQRIHVLGGAGNDSITVRDSRSRRGSGVGGDAGDDSMILSNLRFGNGSCIDGGTGKNTLQETNTRYGVRSTKLNLDPNAPSDTVTRPPTATADSLSVVKNASNTINLAANDVAGTAAINTGSIVITTQPANGTVTVGSNGNVTYQHNGSNTTSDTFAYTIKDINGLTSAPANVQVTVTATPTAPTATADTLSVVRNASTTVNLASNDVAGTAAINTGSIVITTQPANGTVTVGSNGNVTYQHNGSNTNSDTFAYTIKDINGLTSAPANVQVTVTPAPTPPTATADTLSVVRNASTTVNLASNDVAGTAAINTGSIVITTQPTNGTVTVGSNGNVTYQHNGSNTNSDTFAYTIKDINGLTSAPANVQVTVTPAPTPPTATADTLSVVRNASTTVNLASNDVAGTAAINTGSIVITTQPTNGTVTVGSNGNVTYQHNGSNTTSDTFAYTIKDINGLTSTPANVQVTVTASPTPPTVTADTLSVANNASATSNLAANDIAGTAAINTGSIVITTPPVNGTTTVGANGNVTYQHNGSNTTTDTFSYTIKDVNGLTSAPGNVQVTIAAAPPQAPTAVNDTGSVTEGSTTSIAILSNDVPPNGSSLDVTSIVFTDLPTQGTVTKNANGTVTYTHGGGEVTSDVFRYTVRAANGVVSNEATVSISIIAVNDPPVANNDTATGLINGSVNIPVLANDTDVDGNIDVASVTIISQPQFGTLQINNSNGQVTYVHNGTQNLSDSFTYTVKDTLGLVSNIATVSINIVKPPLAQNDQLVVATGASTTIDVTSNDSATAGTLDKQSIVIRSQPVYGNITLLGNGQVRYTHDGTNSTTDQFTYTISDSTGLLSNTATVAVTIQSPNVGPTANNDQATVDEGGTVNISVLANDTDPDNAIDTASLVIVNTPTNGTAVLGVGGVIIYTHNGSNTTVDSFTYRVNDVSGASSGLATVSITINPLNDPPIAQNDSATVQSGTPAIINLATNDSDSDDGLNLASIQIVTQPQHGTVTVNNNGTVSYEHNGSTNLQDSFTYQIRDIAGALSNVATVNLTIERTSLPPLTQNDSANVTEGATANVNVLANDTARDNPIAPSTVVVVTPPSRGTTSVNADGSITYNHNGSEFTSDSFTYRVSDSQGLQSALATVTMTVLPVNDPPVAVNDTDTIASNVQAILELAANDFDLDDGLDLAGIVIGTNPSRGTITVNTDGTVTYVHDGSEVLQDTFTYRIKDKSGALSNEATVSLTIELINQPPVANPDTATLSTVGGQIVIDLAANDTDPDGGLNLGSIVIKTPPTNGNVNVIGDGTVRYTHNGGASTSDSFTYQIRDNAGVLSNEATVSISIEPF